MAKEAHWQPGCVSESLIRAHISELLLSMEFVSPESFFGVYLLRKDGFELQCLLMAIGKITKSILQELSSLFRPVSYIFSSFDYPDKPLGVKRICRRQSPSLLAMHPPQW